MSEAKHTPGPWEFRIYARGCTIVSTHDEPGISVRAALKGVSVLVDAMVRDDQSNAHEVSPDARLIAAAPDLLEACEAMFSIRADCFVTGETSPRLGCVCKMCQSARLAASAIAKAKEGK
jgi:hypothetical protein